MEIGRLFTNPTIHGFSDSMDGNFTGQGISLPIYFHAIQNETWGGALQFDDDCHGAGGGE